MSSGMGLGAWAEPWRISRCWASLIGRNLPPTTWAATVVCLRWPCGLDAEQLRRLELVGQRRGGFVGLGVDGLGVGGRAGQLHRAGEHAHRAVGQADFTRRIAIGALLLRGTSRRTSPRGSRDDASSASRRPSSRASPSAPACSSPRTSPGPSRRSRP